MTFRTASLLENRVSRIAALLLAVALLALGALGCGGDDDNGSGSNGADTEELPGAQLPEPKPGDRPPPPPAALAENFPSPDLRGMSLREQAAVRAGQSACRGKTPLQIRDEYYDEAVASGNLDEDAQELVSDPADFRFEPDEGPSFAAGQLAATVYEATLPERTANAGFQGCVYELARVQVKRMRAAAR